MFEVKDLVKKYDNNIVLNKISLRFPNYGFVCILGKSGCGKSTFLHCIGLLEKIDSGKIYFNAKEVHNLREKDRRIFLNKNISYVFQNYQLIEDRSILYNVALPLLIGGEREKFAFEQAEKMLIEVGFEKEQLSQLARDCSGGEKQRVAILRAIITEPMVVMADEPTGALDSDNTTKICEILYKYSQKHLVIFVTHNEEISDKYSDRTIVFSDGKIQSDKYKRCLDKPINFQKDNGHRFKSSWINSFIENNVKKRFKRNLLSGIACFVSILFSLFIIGFSNGANKEINNQCLRHFDIGTCTVSMQKTNEIEGSKLSLIQQARLNNIELINFINENPYLEYGLNYDALVPQTPFVTFENEELTEFSYLPIYSFEIKNYPDLLIDGKLPKDTLNEVVINRKAYNNFFQKRRKSPLNLEFSINFSREITTYFDDILDPYVTDYFNFSIKAKVVGVVDELDFLSTPKIYYSYTALDEYLGSYIMNNLSSRIGQNLTYKDKVDQVLGNDELSSYSHRIFLKNFDDFEKIELFQNNEIVINNDAIIVKQALSSFVEAATMGTEIFLIITIVGSILILGITTFASYSQDQHQNAILEVLGASRSDILDIYIAESLFIGIFSFIIALVMSIILTPLANYLIFHFSGFNNMILIPYKSWMNYKYLLPVLTFGITILTCIFSSYLPLSLSKKVSLSKELREE